MNKLINLLRLNVRHQKNNTWPPTWQPESEKLKKHFADREKELLRLPGSKHITYC